MNEGKRISETGDALIKHFEVCRLRAYPHESSPLFQALKRDKMHPYRLRVIPVKYAGLGGDPWCIGWVDCKNVSPGQLITRAQAEARYRKRIALDVENAIRCAVQVDMTQSQWEATVAAVYSAGIGEWGRAGVLYTASGLPTEFVEHLNARRFAAAAQTLETLSGLSKVRSKAIKRTFEGESVGAAILEAEKERHLWHN